MALEIKVQKTSITSNCKTFTIDDVTGTYDAITNPGGYGAPNPERSDLYLALVVTLKKSDGDELITVPSYTPNTVTTWSVAVTEDGWYEIYLCAAYEYDSNLTYIENAVVYYPSTNSFYYSVVDNNYDNSVMNDAYWKLVTTSLQLSTAAEITQQEIDDSGNDNQVVYGGQANIIELCNSRVCAARRLMEEGCGCDCDDCDHCCSNKMYNRIRNRIEAAEINESAGSFSKGQVIVESLQVSCQDCKNNC